MLEAIRKFVSALLLYGLCHSAVQISPTIAADPLPNIVHVIVDDLGWNDVGFHGSEIRTPVIDRLAAESLVLDRFYVTSICSPTRAGALTGRYPFRFGIWDGVISPKKRHGLPPSETTIPELLATAGYRQRALMGKWHLGLGSTMFHPLNHGFNEFYGHYNGAIDYFSRERSGQLDWHRNFESAHEEGYSTELLGDEAVRFICRQSADVPFYLLVAFNAPHSPIQSLREDLNAYGFDPETPLAPNTVAGIAMRENAADYGERGRGNSVRQTFSAMTSAMDRNLGKILDALREEGFRENTIVVFHSDNGGIPKHGGDNRPLRGNKFTTWEGGTRVVSMIRYPGRIEPGIYQGLACYLDLLPTLAAAARVDYPADIDGINLLPYVASRQVPPERHLLLGEEAVVSQRWKLVDSQLFDLRDDPYEKQDVSKDHPRIVDDLTRTLEQFRKLAGPPTTTSLPLPSQWPPEEWKLPDEFSEP